jgi:hypothetical protein
MTRRLCLVTGASSGIGAASARVFASRGYDVALTARRADRLDALADEIRLRFGVEAFTLPGDLSDPETPDRLLAGVAEQGRHVDALVNNAGYGLPGAYVATPWHAQRAFLQLMLVSVCDLAHKVLPGMVDRRFGRIVNVASVAGLIPGSAGHTLYAASKSFLVKFSQSLHLECRDTGVHVSALCPGFTYSEFHDANGTRDRVSSNMPEWMWLGADEVAQVGYEAVEANRAVAVSGAPNKAVAAIAKILPDEWSLALMQKQSGRFRQM